MDDPHLKRLEALSQIEEILASVNLRGVVGSFRQHNAINRRLLDAARECLAGLDPRPEPASAGELG